MAERFPGNRAMDDGFGHRWRHGWRACLLHEANDPMPPNMRVLGAWRLSVCGFPMRLPPSDVERHAEIAQIQESLPEDAHQR
ncbi:hypothetical protein D1007_23450 [Hordeum vulgare]|nr:hypothetical protein D1007_23450 [Hordeum vulgare]